MQRRSVCHLAARCIGVRPHCLQCRAVTWSTWRRPCSKSRAVLPVPAERVVLVQTGAARPQEAAPTEFVIRRGLGHVARVAVAPRRHDPVHGPAGCARAWRALVLRREANLRACLLPPIDCVELRLVRRASVQQQSLTRTCLAACVLSMSSLFQLACVHACICVASHRVVYATTAVITKICIALLCVPWLASHASLTTLW